ncbi:MAG: aminotransferase class I/II-fold pyridoxal phosphate-dependent enzyme [Clostridiales bacterium]|nr:aminotransferase class I/II-fold pyridoxal phosphate-dependent enzyme [Clostridiales bacterium]
MNTPIHDFLIKHASKKTISFHMPGHKGAAIYKRFGYDEFLESFMDCDVTEIPGADNLFQAEGIIREAQARYAALYGAKKSYLLVNGTSGGLIAAIAASVPKGKKLIMARNSHKSVFNALTLADIRPVYAYPEIIPGYGISGPVPPEQIGELLAAEPDAEAVILPSPNYYGVCSDVEKIAEITHKHGKTLIIDEAHGAHLTFFNKYGIKSLPKSAGNSGADIVVTSIHKTLASLTQSAVLNINSGKVDSYLVEDKLQCIESTSPSYILMASLDINASIIEEHGKRLFTEWAENLDFFYENAREIENLSVISGEGMDRTKLNFSLGHLGVSGGELEKELAERHGIIIELYAGNLVMCMTGIGNTRGHMVKLLHALDEIAAKNKNREGAEAGGTTHDAETPAVKRAELFEIPKNKKKVPLAEAAGLICAASIIPYPPGIPLVCPGEKLDAEAVGQIIKLREDGEKVIGVDEQGRVLAGA